MRKLLIIVSLLCCAVATSCATDPSSQDLRSPCVSIDHPHSPCVRKTPIENAVV